MARLTGKLTAKSLGWGRDEIGAKLKNMGDNGRINLGRIAGIVSGLHQTFDDEKGTVQVGLKGQFRGVSTNTVHEDTGKKDKDGAPVMKDTGEAIVVTAGRCYLPSGLQDMVEGTYAKATETDPKATVSFALDLFAVKANNKAGYSFDADTLVEAQEADPLDALLETAATNAPAIEDKSGE